MEATNQEGYDRDYNEFLEDLEEDKLFRQNVNIYFSESISVWGRKEKMINGCVFFIDPKLEAPPTRDPDVAEDVPRIGIEEMLQELTISDDKSHDSHVMAGHVDSGGDVVMGSE